MPSRVVSLVKRDLKILNMLNCSNIGVIDVDGEGMTADTGECK